MAEVDRSQPDRELTEFHSLAPIAWVGVFRGAIGQVKNSARGSSAAMNKIPDCDRCQLYARTPYLICAVHPTGVESAPCPDFHLDPAAAPEELWQPVAGLASFIYRALS